MTEDDLSELLRKAKVYVDALSPEELKEMLQKQAESWARGEAAMGESAVYHKPESDEGGEALLRAEVKRLREQLAECRRNMVRVIQVKPE